MSARPVGQPHQSITIAPLVAISITIAACTAGWLTGGNDHSSELYQLLLGAAIVAWTVAAMTKLEHGIDGSGHDLRNILKGSNRRAKKKAQEHHEQLVAEMAKLRNDTADAIERMNADFTAALAEIRADFHAHTRQRAVDHYRGMVADAEPDTPSLRSV